jgi:hypothetical protein
MKFRKIELLDRVCHIAAAQMHSGCVTEDGKVMIWGLSGNSQELSQKKKFLHKIPTEISFSRFGRVQIDDLKLGNSFSVALSKKGEVFTWGSNDKGQLGLGDQLPRTQPEQVRFQSSIVQISVGLQHCIAVTKNLQLYGWGDNKFGQIGQETPEYMALSPLKLGHFGSCSPLSIECGYYSTLCISQGMPDRSQSDVEKEIKEEETKAKHRKKSTLLGSDLLGEDPSRIDSMHNISDVDSSMNSAEGEGIARALM